MFSRELRHLFGAYAALPFLLILSSHHSCSATKNTSYYCAPSSCGHIHNISYPFRLNTDPQSCGNKNYELACENNVRPTLYLNMVKYYVQAINYSNFTIRLVDASVQKDDCFSIPHHSLTEELLYYYYYYEIKWPHSSVLTFLCCKNQMLNPPGYIMDASSCKNGSGTAYNSSSSGSISSPSCVDMEGHSYVMVGEDIQDVPDLCRINLIYSVPKIMTNMSYTDVHDILVYGFELSWFSFCCHYNIENRCNLDEATMKNNYCLQYTIENYFGTLLNLYFEGIAGIFCRGIGDNYCDYGIHIPSILPIFLILFSIAMLVFIANRQQIKPKPLSSAAPSSPLNSSASTQINPQLRRFLLKTIAASPAWTRGFLLLWSPPAVLLVASSATPPDKLPSIFTAAPPDADNSSRAIRRCNQQKWRPNQQPTSEQPQRRRPLLSRSSSLPPETEKEKPDRTRKSKTEADLKENRGRSGKQKK